MAKFPFSRYCIFCCWDSSPNVPQQEIRVVYHGS